MGRRNLPAETVRVAGSGRDQVQRDQTEKDQTAAWTADGALGPLRPRASGSRCGRNATRHDLRLSAATRRRTGIAPVATATLALTAREPARLTESTAAASTATESTGA